MEIPIIIVTVIISIGLLVVAIMHILKARKNKLPPKINIEEVNSEEIDNIISEITNEEDHVFKNVLIEYDERKIEAGLVIVNKNGIFIIDVNKYSGVFRGTQDDAYWTKYIKSEDGQASITTVENPRIVQNREIDLLRKCLKQFGKEPLIYGVIYFINKNSPILTSYIVESTERLEKAIHISIDSEYEMDEATIKEIMILLKL